jgi:glutathione S-transferase
MILVGRNSSPFVRRVAISLHLLEIPFEQEPLSAIKESEKLRAVNPLGRIPAMKLADGEVLIDSNVILDHLDQLAGPDRALVPPAEPARRRVMGIVGYALGVMEKSLACFIERKLRADGTLDGDLLGRFVGQAKAGLAALEEKAGDGWMCEGKLTQADVSTIVALEFLRLSWPEQLSESNFPRLEALSARAHALPAFALTKP